MNRRRHRQTAVLVLLVAIALVAIAGYAVWQGDQQDGTSTRITRTSSTCAQVDRLYTDLITLEADNPRFTLERRRAMVLQRRDRLTAQGCK